MRGEGRSCGVSANEYSCEHHVIWSQRNFGDLPPYLTYACSQQRSRSKQHKTAHSEEKFELCSIYVPEKQRRHTTLKIHYQHIMGPQFDSANFTTASVLFTPHQRETRRYIGYVVIVLIIVCPMLDCCVHRVN